MAREPERTTINGHEWEVYPWDGMHGLRMQARLGRALGPAIASMSNVEDVMDMDVQQIVGALSGQIDEKETPQLIRDMLHGASVEGKDVTMDRVFNEHFSANYAELYEGLAFIVRVNFGDLFQMAAAIGGQGAPAKE